MRRVLQIALIALLLTISTAGQATMAEGEHCGATQITDRDRQDLLKAKIFAHGDLGESRQADPGWAAFQKYLKFGASARGELKTIVQTGTPAGKLYAVILLKQFDSEGAIKILKRMKEDKTAVEYFRGCKGYSTTVEQLATKILAGDEIVKMKEDQAHR